MSYTTTQTYENLIIDINGAFDSQAAKELREEFEHFIDHDERGLAISLRRCEFLDSSGIGALVFAYKRLNAQGRNLLLYSVHGQPQWLIEMLHVQHTIPMFESHIGGEQSDA